MALGPLADRTRGTVVARRHGTLSQLPGRLKVQAGGQDRVVHRRLRRFRPRPARGTHGPTPTLRPGRAGGLAR
ncbi:MAG: hypothetical protein ACK559_06965, partial [bacterium]